MNYTFNHYRFLEKYNDGITEIKPLVIFDLDGTLADITHRVPLLENKEDPDRWEKFYKACINDKPIEPAVSLFVYFNYLDNIDVQIWTGRSDEVKSQTYDWLVSLPDVKLYIPCPYGQERQYIERCIPIKMRKQGDHRPDYVLKSEWHDSMSAYDKDRLMVVYEDRKQVVDMWRSKGVFCCQVANGDF